MIFVVVVVHTFFTCIQQGFWLQQKNEVYTVWEIECYSLIATVGSWVGQMFLLLSFIWLTNRIKNKMAIWSKLLAHFKERPSKENFKLSKLSVSKLCLQAKFTGSRVISSIYPIHLPGIFSVYFRLACRLNVRARFSSLYNFLYLLDRLIVSILEQV